MTPRYLIQSDGQLYTARVVDTHTGEVLEMVQRVEVVIDAKTQEHTVKLTLAPGTCVVDVKAEKLEFSPDVQKDNLRKALDGMLSALIRAIPPGQGIDCNVYPEYENGLAILHGGKPPRPHILEGKK